MPVIIVAEGGRTWPEGPGADPCDGFCGPEDTHAWGRRLYKEVGDGNTALQSLAPGGQWLGPAAESLAGEIEQWQDGAREDADTSFYDTTAGAAFALAQGGYGNVIDDLAVNIEQGMALNNRARVMAFEAGQGPEPEPVPTTETEPEPEPEEGGGGGVAIVLGIAALVGVGLYMRKRKK